LSYQQDRTANQAQPAALFDPILACYAKAIMGFQFISPF
jgi:hypothetical protein